MGTATPPPGLDLFRRLLDEGFAAGRTEVVDEVCSPDFLEHQFGLEGAGAEGLETLRTAMRQVHRATPDIRYTVEDWAERGDTLWVRLRARGTNTGPFMGPPSGRPVDITVLDVVRVVDGRIVEHWGVPDRFALLTQTGVLDRLRPPSPQS
ncbi:ester cyclase [Georgenia yuyongxinii]|uniref:Ester cyclase n=1 Tax=Georgenia yuyongxinii TaxID=2589797 RepID=A0A552WJF7_9MICO|nr:ester cyclase [Georgenia yuyongxinii]TRW42895.1 ester cyclase [Georgenia yuyongxinii]